MDINKLNEELQQFLELDIQTIRNASAKRKNIKNKAEQKYLKNKDLYDKKEQEYYAKCVQKSKEFFNLKDEYVDKITNILEADGWDLTQSEVIHGFNVEYTYEKYIDVLNDYVYCVFTNDGEFYGISFSINSPNNEDWDEFKLSNFIELPNHPVYPEKMDHINLDPRYDGPTAEDEWEQYVTFVKNMIKTLKNPKVIKEVE